MSAPMASVAPAARPAETPLARFAADFAANPIAVFGALLFLLILLLAVFAPLVSPQNPYDLAQLDVMDGRLPPGSPAPGARRRAAWLSTSTAAARTASTAPAR